MDDESDALAFELVRAGVTCASLICDPKSWINRRVETVDILSREETRRRVSIDFTLDARQVCDLTCRDGVVVPISVLTKDARRDFDLRDEAGRSVPVLGKGQNGRLAHIALMHAVAEAVSDKVPAEVLASLSADMRKVVFEPSERAAEALGHFIGDGRAGDRWRSVVWRDPVCQSLLATLWANYVLFAVVTPDGPPRRILKYAYGEKRLVREDRRLRKRFSPTRAARRAWLPDREGIVVEYPGAWRAASFHAEIVIPEELRITYAVLVDETDGEPLSARADNVDRASLYASRDIVEAADVLALTEVASERGGSVFQSAITGVLVAALLWLGVMSDLDARNPGPAVSVLLAGAALFSGVAASRGEHRLVRAVFSGTRRWLAAIALAALAASSSLAMEMPDPHPLWVWRVAAVVCSAAALRLSWAAIRAPG